MSLFHSLDGQDDEARIALQKDLSSIFLFSNADLYYRSIEFSLLLQCFYIALWCTNFAIIGVEVQNIIKWEILLFIPIPLNFLLLKLILNFACLLRSLSVLDEDIAARICEDALDERVVTQRLRKMVRTTLSEIEPDKNNWHYFLNEVFGHYVPESRSGVSPKQFTLFLHGIQIHLSKDSVKRIFHVIDFDQSGYITWDELSSIIFPELLSSKRKEIEKETETEREKEREREKEADSVREKKVENENERKFEKDKGTEKLKGKEKEKEKRKEKEKEQGKICLDEIYHPSDFKLKALLSDQNPIPNNNNNVRKNSGNNVLNSNKKDKKTVKDNREIKININDDNNTNVDLIPTPVVAVRSLRSLPTSKIESDINLDLKQMNKKNKDNIHINYQKIKNKNEEEMDYKKEKEHDKDRGEKEKYNIEEKEIGNGTKKEIDEKKKLIEFTTDRMVPSEVARNRTVSFSDENKSVFIDEEENFRPSVVTFNPDPEFDSFYDMNTCPSERSNDIDDDDDDDDDNNSNNNDNYNNTNDYNDYNDIHNDDNNDNYDKYNKLNNNNNNINKLKGIEVAGEDDNNDEYQDNILLNPCNNYNDFNHLEKIEEGEEEEDDGDDDDKEGKKNLKFTCHK